jgi:hypothetical protein
MRRAFRYFSFRLCPVLLLALPVARAQTDISWVHGSWVNVRETAESASAVVDHVTTNTQVTVLARQDGRCEIVWDESKRGFVPCRLLGDRALTLAETTKTSYGGYYGIYYLTENLKDNPQYSPLRTFWMLPSAITLSGAGLYFQRTLLSAKQWDLEHGRNVNDGMVQDKNGEWPDPLDSPPRLVRYPVSEFEAMKALLAEGIVAKAYWNPQLLSCQQLQQIPLPSKENIFGEHYRLWLQIYFPDQNYGILPENYRFFERKIAMVEDCQRSESLLRLPKIHPSFFKSTKDILPGNAYIEQISAHFGIVERGRRISGPRWGYPSSRNDGDYFYSGAWDIGRYELKLDKPIMEHVIGHNGLVGVYQWTPQTQFDFNDDGGDGTSSIGGCVEELRRWEPDNKTMLANYAAVEDALLWFQSPVALPLQRAKVSRHATSLNVGNATQNVTVYEIDLDNDGIADFVKWDSTMNEVGSYVIFVNINGEWYPFEKEYTEMCGC